MKLYNIEEIKADIIEFEQVSGIVLPDFKGLKFTKLYSEVYIKPIPDVETVGKLKSRIDSFINDTNHILPEHDIPPNDEYRFTIYGHDTPHPVVLGDIKLSFVGTAKTTKKLLKWFTEELKTQYHKFVIVDNFDKEVTHFETDSVDGRYKVH
jgi:hypothetical protein